MRRFCVGEEKMVGERDTDAGHVYVYGVAVIFRCSGSRVEWQSGLKLRVSEREAFLLDRVSFLSRVTSGRSLSIVRPCDPLPLPLLQTYL